MNTVILQGNLARDPELKYTPKGTAVVEFTVCVNEEYQPKGGEKKQTTSFIECKAWSGMAEKVGTGYKKGAAAYVIGKLRVDSWEDKETKKKRYKTYVLADAVTSPFGAGRPKAESEPTPPVPEPDPTDQLPF